MYKIIQFAVALGIISLSLSCLSIFWPKISKDQRPVFLQKTYDIVKNTQFGTDTARVLGVSDNSPVEPINFQTAAGVAVSAVTNAVEKKTQQIIVTQAINQLLNQYDALNQDQKQQIKDAICSESNKDK